MFAYDMMLQRLIYKGKKALSIAVKVLYSLSVPSFRIHYMANLMAMVTLMPAMQKKVLLKIEKYLDNIWRLLVRRISFFSFAFCSALSKLRGSP